MGIVEWMLCSPPHLRCGPFFLNALMAADSTVTPALPALKHIQITLSTLLVAITGLWLLADPMLLAPFNWLVLRSSLIAYTGMLSIGTMSMALVLAVRPMGLEQWLGGLDRIYRLHKWLGISTLITISLHWTLTKAPKWLAELGLIPRPEHGAHALQTDPFFRALQTERGLAESVGEWAFYGAVVR
ncbi:ferric reductase-like transmembrane domain-containing protein [Variovorax sp. H27-G14]|uniref:ferric reductase-like transmembrane domain-containing protein n=1 Tax=Variovorax sp. H27-G14 TaxID=3111914 RepID=UPI0038FD1A63